MCVCDVFLLHFCSGMLITVDFKWWNDVIWTRLWHATSLFYNMLSYDIVLIDFQLAAVVASVGIFWHPCRTVHSRYWYLDQCVHCPAPLLWCRNVLDWKCLGSEVSDPRSDYHVLQPVCTYLFYFSKKNDLWLSSNKIYKNATAESLESWLHMLKLKSKPTPLLTDARLYLKAVFISYCECQLH